jgi:hypothetical protein
VFGGSFAQRAPGTAGVGTRPRAMTKAPAGVKMDFTSSESSLPMSKNAYATTSGAGGSGLAMTMAETRQAILSEMQEPPKEDKNDQVLDIINKVTMFKIVVDKVNEKNNLYHKENTKKFSKWSVGKGQRLIPEAREQIFSLADLPSVKDQ